MKVILDRRLRFVMTAFGLLALAASVQAKDKKPKPAPTDPQDQIEVVGHIPLTNGAVKRFVATQHYSSYYLYAEHDAGQSVTLVDVTKPSRPAVLGDVSYPANGGTGSLFTVAGTAALVADGQSGSASAAPTQNIRIMDFSDPRNPKVAREFTGVTAIQRDDRRGLVFVAASDGLWILQEHLATDPAVEKAYDYYIRYGSSMYPRGQ